MRLSIAFALLGASLVQAAVCPAALTAELPRSSPEEQGVSSKAVLEFIEAADNGLDSLHSMMLVRHGHVVAEGWWTPYSPEARHSLYSLSKSFTSTAVGLAIAEGKLSVDDEVLKFFPDDAPSEPSSNLRAMRVSDLLRMSTGHQTEPPRGGDQPWVKSILAHPVPFKPGTHFLYNTSGSYMLSAIVQKATGQTVVDYLGPRLFAPLGIDGATWDSSPQGVTLGGYGLSVRTGDIARFGLLYLHSGQWDGKQLLPKSWIDSATARQTSNGSNPHSDWDQGYGYQFWRCRHNVYRGDGAFGQYCIVLPEEDAVIAITAGLRDMQQALNVVWDKLLPALHDATLPPDADAAARLADRLKTLSLRTPVTGGTAADISGKKYAFPTNDRRLETASLKLGDDGAVSLITRWDGREQTIDFGRDAWRKGHASWGWLSEQPVAASGAWTADGTYTGKLCFYETPFVITLTLAFSGDHLRLTSAPNVSIGPAETVDLTGKAE